MSTRFPDSIFINRPEFFRIRFQIRGDNRKRTLTSDVRDNDVSDSAESAVAETVPELLQTTQQQRCFQTPLINIRQC